ncbi:hypothetical protein SprV_1002832200 [Sparganum proliferum]
MYVRQDETVFRSGCQEEQFVIVKIIETMETQNSSPGSMVFADVSDKFTKDKSPSGRLRGQECVQFRVEFVSRLGGTAHRRSVDNDKGGTFSTPERRAEAHQAIVDAQRQTGQLSHDVVPDAKVTPASRRFALGQPLQKKV